MDFFTVPKISFQVLYGFFVIAHDRRRILHFNVTAHPSSRWITQQLREAFPFEAKARYLIFDRSAPELASMAWAKGKLLKVAPYTNLPDGSTAVPVSVAPGA